MNRKRGRKKGLEGKRYHARRRRRRTLPHERAHLFLELPPSDDVLALTLRRREITAEKRVFSASRRQDPHLPLSGESLGSSPPLFLSHQSGQIGD